MSQFRQSILISFLAVSSLTALAQPYVEVNYSSIDIWNDHNVGRIETTPTMFGGIIGYQLNKNLALEAMFASGVRGSDTTVNGTTQTSPVKTDVDHYYGVFLRPSYSITEQVELFAKLGRVRGKTTSSSTTASSTTVGSNWTYGIGANLNLSSRSYATVNLLKTPLKDGVQSQTWSVGLGYRF